MTGYTVEEAVGETPAILSSGEYDDEFYEELWDTIQAGQQWKSEMIDQRKEGDQVILDQTIAPIEIDSGTLEGYVAVNRDVTEHRKREKQLQIYEYAYESALSGLAIANFDGELRSLNPASREMWGTTRKRSSSASR
ncbi:bacterio-opsin activator [Halolamina pelagica]|uniref:Bacterio-opsin activator n=1 Tax=Halolamina pelagica TaxID=699431 RepID=A0A0P7FR39_9EURY|nr:bacterio-opsin activator [Halolamina pelagica]